MPYSTIVSVDTLNAHTQDPDWIVFDCRFALNDTEKGRRDYRASHIPGALYAHLDEVLSAPRSARTGRHPLPDVARFSEWLGEQGVDADKQVAAYDDADGAFAARLWWMLRWLGHTSVAVLDGGWQAWIARGLAVDSRIEDRARSVFTPRPDRDMWLDVDQLTAQMQDDAVRVLDARAPQRYSGEEDPIDPVAGHIPGSLNRPYKSNLTAEQRFRPAAELKREFTSLLSGRTAASTVHSCGSGVTACHNLLAMELAGLHGSRLYPGSWSEWITDPGRPVATGKDP